MSLVNDQTGPLFRTFMPRRKEILQAKNAHTIDLKVYPPGYFQGFNPTAEFTKWVLVEVDTVADIPSGMETFELAGGQYAVFHYKGLSSDPSIFQYIFSQWIPNSKYMVDDRPHFEVLGAKYKNNDPNSEEEIWIPIKEK